MPSCCDIAMTSLSLPDGDDESEFCILTFADLELKDNLPFPPKSDCRAVSDACARKKHVSAKKKVFDQHSYHVCNSVCKHCSARQ